MNKGTAVLPSPAAKPAQSEPLANRAGLGDDHPLNDIMGTHSGDAWEHMLKNIKRNRKKLDRQVGVNDAKD